MNQKIAQRVKELRCQSGISQESLSHLAQLDRKYIGIIEKGQTNVSVKVLSKIWEALDSDLEAFFAGIEKPHL